MRSVLLALIILCTASASSFAVVDLAGGAYGGMVIPAANEQAELGPLFGVQARLSFFQFLAIGAHYQNANYGDPELTFFEGTPQQITSTKDGGMVNTFAGDLYLGRVGGQGFNFYLVGSIGSFQWTRDSGDITKALYAAGLGFEIILPMRLGVEARTMFEVAPFGGDDTGTASGDGSYKNVTWFIGANYHFGTQAP